MSNEIRYTGGTQKANKWPHPMNEDFNNIIRNTVKIYGVGAKKDKELLLECKNYLNSRIEGLIDHKVVRESEEHYRLMDLKIEHGYNKDESEQHRLISDCSYILCVGDWIEDPKAEQQYRMAIMLGKQALEMRYEKSIPLPQILRYLQPVRPIKDSSWDESKKDDVLIFETDDGLLELMDGNHRHEFANRVGGVTHLSGWIIKYV